MNTMFNKSKVKSWIKKARKNSSFGYGHGYVTDGYAMLVDEPHMHPTILEVFGTLAPECKYPAHLFQETATLPEEPIEVIDSELEYVPDPKSRLRIFYDPKTGRKLTINGMYFDLLDSPRAYKFYTNDSMTTTIWIVYDEEVVGVVAPILLQDQLSHIEFKGEEAVKVNKEQEMRKEARAAIIKALEDGYSGYYCDLHHEVFNTSYYILDTEQAKEALAEYDVWDAIEKVQTYEMDNFGEVYTDLSDPVKLINMLHYIIGEEVLYEMMDSSDTWNRNWNEKATEEINAEILEELGK